MPVPNVTAKLLAYSLLVCCLLASDTTAADVYANFVDFVDNDRVFDPAYDVGNPGCFSLDSKNHNGIGVYFTQYATTPGRTAHGPYCLSIFTDGGCPSDQLGYQNTYWDVQLNNQYTYLIKTCLDKGQQSYQWSLEQCNGNPSGNNPIPSGS